MQIIFPTGARIINFTWEWWSPGRIVHRLRDGSFDEPLIRAETRLRGTVTFSKWSSLTPASRRISAQVQHFTGLISDPENWVEMPWGVEDRGMVVPGGGYTGRVVSTTNGVHTLTRRRGTTVLTRGDWVRANHRVVQVATVAGTDAAPQITTYPAITVPDGFDFVSADTIRVQNRDGAETSAQMSHNPSFSMGPVWQWEERVQ